MQSDPVYVYVTRSCFPDNFLTFILIAKLAAHQYGSMPKILHGFSILRKKGNRKLNTFCFPFSVFHYAVSCS